MQRSPLSVFGPGLTMPGGWEGLGRRGRRRGGARRRGWPLRVLQLHPGRRAQAVQPVGQRRHHNDCGRRPGRRRPHDHRRPGADQHGVDDGRIRNRRDHGEWEHGQWEHADPGDRIERGGLDLAGADRAGLDRPRLHHGRQRADLVDRQWLPGRLPGERDAVRPVGHRRRPHQRHHRFDHPQWRPDHRRELHRRHDPGRQRPIAARTGSSAAGSWRRRPTRPRRSPSPNRSTSGPCRPTARRSRRRRRAI